MVVPTSPEDSTRFVPDSLYNVFAYLSTGILFFSLASVLFLDLSVLVASWKSLQLAGQLAIVPSVLSAVYVYSEFISVASYHAVRKPVSFVVRTLQPRAVRDFFFDYQGLLKEFTLLEEFSDKRRNYWTLIYWIKIHYPSIANDILERHARVKMARMNALNCFVLFLLSVLSIFVHPTVTANALISTTGGKWAALIGSAAATVLFSFEFYQRQCWFADIVLKIFASLTRETGRVTSQTSPSIVEPNLR